MKPRDILLFHSADKRVNVSVYFQNGTFWLTQKAMAELFGVNVPAVSKHLKNIFDTRELEQDSVVSKMETTAADGKNYEAYFYRLEDTLKVKSEYVKFCMIQDRTYENNFDTLVKETINRKINKIGVCIGW